MPKEKISRLEQPKQLSERLKALKGAEVENLETPKSLEQKGMELFRLNIKDAKKWDSKKDMEILVDVFGQAALQAFGPRESAQEFDMTNKNLRKAARENLNSESDMGDSDHIYVVAKDGKLAAFLSGIEKELPENQKGYYINLVFTDPKLRNHHLCRGLYSEIFKLNKYDAIMACSTTPGVLKEQQYVAKEFGHTTFIAGFREGKINDRGTADEQKKNKKITQQIQNYYLENEATSEELMAEFPDHLVIFKENDPIPPLTEKDVNFEKLGKPLEKVYRKILSDQSQAEHTIYTMVFSFPNKK